MTFFRGIAAFVDDQLPGLVIGVCLSGLVIIVTLLVLLVSRV